MSFLLDGIHEDLNRVHKKVNSSSSAPGHGLRLRERQPERLACSCSVVEMRCPSCVCMFAVSGKARLVFQGSKRSGRERDGCVVFLPNHAPISVFFFFGIKGATILLLFPTCVIRNVWLVRLSYARMYLYVIRDQSCDNSPASISFSRRKLWRFPSFSQRYMLNVGSGVVTFCFARFFFCFGDESCGGSPSFADCRLVFGRTMTCLT